MFIRRLLFVTSPGNRQIIDNGRNSARTFGAMLYIWIEVSVYLETISPNDINWMGISSLTMHFCLSSLPFPNGGNKGRVRKVFGLN